MNKQAYFSPEEIRRKEAEGRVFEKKAEALSILENKITAKIQETMTPEEADSIYRIYDDLAFVSSDYFYDPDDIKHGAEKYAKIVKEFPYATPTEVRFIHIILKYDVLRNINENKKTDWWEENKDILEYIEGIEKNNDVKATDMLI